MSLESSINTIVTTLQPGATYTLASKFRANQNSFHIEDADLPFIVLDNELTKNATLQQNGTTTKETKIIMWFLDNDTPDNTDVQTNTIQQAMELIACQVAQAIFRLEEVIQADNQKFKLTPLFHVYNSDLSGCALEMLVNENNLISCT